MDYTVKFKPLKNVKREPVLEVSIDENKNKVLVQKDTVDKKKIINSYKDSCSIERIVAKYNLGDDTVLAAHEGVYINKDTADALMSDRLENRRALNQTYQSLYNTFSKTHDISYEKMVELIKAGKVDELSKYVKKSTAGGEN